MDSFAKPIQGLIDALSWFVRAREVSYLRVVAPPDLRGAVLRVIASQEVHPENRSPFVLLEDSFSLSNEGWIERTERLRAEHAHRQDAMMAEGEDLPDLPDRPEAREPVAVFAAQLAQRLSARASFHEGLVIVMAPSRVDEESAWTARLRALISAASLGDVRWIIVDSAADSVDPLGNELGERAMHVICQVNEAEAQRDFAQMLENADSAPPDVAGPARVGAAWPAGVSPPPRLDRPAMDPGATDAMLEEVGISMPLAGEHGTTLSRAIVLGAQALRRGNISQAVEHQTRARDLCLELSLVREAILMELVLGAYLVHLGELRRAVDTYQSASLRSEQSGLGQLGSQAQMALGALSLRSGLLTDAAEAYLKGARLAREGKSALLSIECLRSAGQVRIELGDETAAVELWRTAINEARAASPEEAKASSAVEAARALAILYRKRGLIELALEMEAQSRALV